MFGTNSRGRLSQGTPSSRLGHTTSRSTARTFVAGAMPEPPPAHSGHSFTQPSSCRYISPHSQESPDLFASYVTPPFNSQHSSKLSPESDGQSPNLFSSEEFKPPPFDPSEDSSQSQNVITDITSNVQRRITRLNRARRPSRSRDLETGTSAFHHGDVKPTVDAKPVVGGLNSVHGNVKPVVDFKPIVGGLNSDHGNVKPVVDVKPIVGGLNSVDGNVKPVVDFKPIVDGLNSAAQDVKPTVSGVNSGVLDVKPLIGSTKTTFTDMKPAVGENINIRETMQAFTEPNSQALGFEGESEPQTPQPDNAFAESQVKRNSNAAVSPMDTEEPLDSQATDQTDSTHYSPESTHSWLGVDNNDSLDLDSDGSLSPILPSRETYLDEEAELNKRMSKLQQEHEDHLLALRISQGIDPFVERQLRSRRSKS